MRYPHGIGNLFDSTSWPFADLLTLSERIGPQAPLGMLHEVGGLAVKMQVSGQRRHQHVFGCTFDLVPPAGFEPALTAPEAVALSPELRGLKDRSKVTSPGHAASACTGAGPGPGQDHLGQVVASTRPETLTSRPWRRDWDACWSWTTMR